MKKIAASALALAVMLTTASCVNSQTPTPQKTTSEVYEMDRDKLPPLVELLPYECVVLPENASDESALAEFERLCREGEKDGFRPIMMRDDSSHITREAVAMLLADNKDFDNHVKSILDASEQVDLDAFYEEQTAEFGQFMGTWDSSKLDPDCADYDVFLDMMGPGETVIVKLPTDKPWETLAYLPFCSGYESPGPEVFVAFAKRWFDTFGAIPAFISYDTIQFRFPTNLDNVEITRQVAQQMFYINPESMMDSGVQDYAQSFIYKRRAVILWWD